MVRLLKYESLGNDFLVLLDPSGGQPVDGATARALCHRRRGVGADGLIRATTPGPPGPDLAMELYNADGSRAEISGNGLRCLARAAVDAGLHPGPELVIGTDAGERRAVVAAEGVRVDMGRADVAVTGGPHGTAVDLGNPHLVIRVADPGGADLAGLAAPHPEVNVHVYAPGPEPDAVTMRTWERGVGETEACGSGACAVALTAHRGGLAGPTVTVHHAGGDAVVELGGARITLSGPVEGVAAVEVPWP